MRVACELERNCVGLGLSALILKGCSAIEDRDVEVDTDASVDTDAEEKGPSSVLEDLGFWYCPSNDEPEFLP